MLGLLIIIVVSWMLLHFFEKESIRVLGIVPTGKHILQFLIGMLFIIILMLFMIYVETLVKSIAWKANTIDFSLIGNSFLYHLRSALTEDLVFRGAILYILISKLNAKWAILISAICFGVYHVFSYGMLSDRLIPIIFVTIVTGAIGYVWAYTFYKTKSIMLGLGFHLGSNLIQTFFFSSQPYGELLFTEVSSVSLLGWNEFYFSLFKGLFPPIVIFLFVKTLLRFNLSIFQKE